MTQSVVDTQSLNKHVQPNGNVSFYQALEFNVQKLIVIPANMQCRCCILLLLIIAVCVFSNSHRLCQQVTVTVLWSGSAARLMTTAP